MNCKKKPRDCGWNSTNETRFANAEKFFVDNTTNTVDSALYRSSYECIWIEIILNYSISNDTSSFSTLPRDTFWDERGYAVVAWPHDSSGERRLLKTSLGTRRSFASSGSTVHRFDRDQKPSVLVGVFCVYGKTVRITLCSVIGPCAVRSAKWVFALRLTTQSHDQPFTPPPRYPYSAQGVSCRFVSSAVNLTNGCGGPERFGRHPNGKNDPYTLPPPAE